MKLLNLKEVSQFSFKTMQWRGTLDRCWQFVPKDRSSWVFEVLELINGPFQYRYVSGDRRASTTLHYRNFVGYIAGITYWWQVSWVVTPARGLEILEPNTLNLRTFARVKIKTQREPPFKPLSKGHAWTFFFFYYYDFRYLQFRLALTHSHTYTAHCWKSANDSLHFHNSLSSPATQKLAIGYDVSALILGPFSGWISKKQFTFRISLWESSRSWNVIVWRIIIMTDAFSIFPSSKVKQTKKKPMTIPASFNWPRPNNRTK